MNPNDLRKPLQIGEIDFRVQSISASGWATILAYKNARVDMERLDSVLGCGFWTRKHEVINGHLFCSVGIWNKELNQFVYVQDVGVESNQASEKGEASDSFKRACFNLGIGRELYNFPLILVKLQTTEFSIEGNKGKQTYELRIKDWTWYLENTPTGEVTFLAAQDDKLLVRWKWGNRNAKTETK